MDKEQLLPQNMYENDAWACAHFGDCQGWTPLFLENVQTDATVAIDVWMVNLCLEIDLLCMTLYRDLKNSQAQNTREA